MKTKIFGLLLVVIMLFGLMVACGDNDSDHTHSYINGKCSCGEKDPNHTHSFVNGKCVCGENEPPHEHKFIKGKCECGAEDPTYVPPHEHYYEEGKCSCGAVDPNYRPPIDIPPSTDPEEGYQVKFVYRYYLTYINDFDRMESKAFTINVKTDPYQVPLTNEGFTAEQLEEISKLMYNGYGFANWYIDSDWDDANYTFAEGATPFDFAAEDFVIDRDMTFYAYRGNLAGANATWAITTEGEGKNQETVLTISGEGALFDYAAISNIDIPWYADRAKITKIVVGDGITHIGANTFNSLYAADDVTLPSSIKTIGDSAFRGMTKLVAMKTPASLEKIGTSAFAETALKSVVLNEGLVEIGDSAFNGSNKIVSVVVPKTLKIVKTGAFHPGSTDGKVNSTALKYVYYLGSEAEFAKIDIGLDNAWFNELSSVYCTAAEGVDPTVEKGPYWKYYSYVDDESGETVVTDTPVPYYYMIKYKLNSSVYGLYTPIAVDYVPTQVAVNEDGTISVSATVDKSNVKFAEDLVYHNFKFVRYTNAVTEGMKLTDDKDVTCEVYTNTRVTPSETAVGSNKGYLSNKGGIVWEFNFGTRTLTVSLGAKPVDLEGIIAIVAGLAKDYKGEITGDSVISEILGIITADDIAKIAKDVGLSSAAEFEALANKLATLELSSANDPLVATAKVLAEQGIVTVEDLGAFVSAIAAEGAADDADLQAKLAALADASLDAKNLQDLYNKIVAAEISGSIEAEFTALSTQLAALESIGILVTDVHASMIARETAIKALADAVAKEFIVGDAQAFDKAVTVSDLATAATKLQDDEGLFKTWDYLTTEDTSVMYASSRSYTYLIEKIVIEDGVKHIGRFAFASLPNIREVVIPESVTSIDNNAFSGCSALNSIYYNGSDLNSVKVLNANRGAGYEAGTLYQDRILEGHYASVFAYTETAQSGEGKFWMNAGDTKVAWWLTGSKLFIGGPTLMYSFETPEAAPWYGAKDSIATVAIANHITHIGENIANGYANVMDLDIGEDFGAVRSIPKSAFAGTGVLLGNSTEDKYNKKGYLVVDHYLLAYNGEAKDLEVPTRTVTIAEGAFDNVVDLYSVFVPHTVVGMHAKVFYNNVPTIIFFKGTSENWYTQCGNLVFPEGAEYYVALSDKKDTDNGDFFFKYEEIDGERVITEGCIHVFSSWVTTLEPTCTKVGIKERVCSGSCGKTFYEEIPALDHDWTAWTPVAGVEGFEERWCQNENCDAKCSVEGCTIHADHIKGCPDDCTAHNGETCITEGCAPDCTLHTGDHIVGCPADCTEHAEGEHIVGCADDCTLHNGEDHIVACAPGCTLHTGAHIEGCAEDCTAHKQAAHEMRPINSIFDFEDAVVDDSQIKLTNTANSSASIVDANGSKVFVFDKKEAKEARFTVYRTQSAMLESATLSTYTSKIQINHTSGSAAVQFILQDATDTSKRAVIIEFVSKDGKNLMIGSKSNTSDAVAVKTDFVDAGVKLGDWFDLKIEYCSAGVATVYVNGTAVYVVDTFYGAEVDGAAAPAASVANTLYVAPYNSFVGSVCLDDVVFKLENNEEYVPGKLTFSPITFDDDSQVNAIGTSGSAITTPAAIYVDAESGNKYWQVSRKAGSSSVWTVYPSYTSKNANAAIFETDFKLYSSNPTGSKAFSFNFKGGSQGTAYMLEVRFPTKAESENEIILYMGDKSVSSDSQSFKSGFFKPTEDVKNGEWFNLRVEYYEAKDGDALSVRILVYVNDELIIYSNNWYGVTQGATSVPSPAKVSEISSVSFNPYTSNAGDYAFDNLSYVHVWREAPTAPVTIPYDDFMEDEMNGTMPEGNNPWYSSNTLVDDRAEVVGKAEVILPDVPEQDEETNYIKFEDLSAVPAQFQVQATPCDMQIVSEGSNKFLRINKTASGGNTRFITSLTEEKNKDANLAVFEARVRYNFASADAAKPNAATNMFFIKDKNTGDRAFEFQFNVEGGKVVFYTVAAGGTDYTTDKTETNIASSDWFDLRIEYADGGVLTVYANGNKVLESANYYTQSAAALDASEIDSAWFVPFGNVTGNFDFDNFAFYHVADEASHEHKFVDGKCDCGAEDPNYVPEAPVLVPEGAVDFENVAAFPVYSGVISVLNNTQTSASQYTDADGKKQNVYAEDGVTPIPSFKGTVSVVDGVLRIVDVSAKSFTSTTTDPEIAKTEDLGQAIFRFVPDAAPEGNTIIFQTRIRIAPLEDGKKNYNSTGSGIDLRMSFGTTGSDNYMAAYVFVDGGKLVFADRSNSKATVVTTVEEGDFATLTFIYTYDEAAGTSVGKVIVTDKYGVETEAEITSVAKPVSELVRCNAIFNKPFQGIAEFDNVFVGGELTYPEPPKPQVIPENALTFDEMAAGDWTTNGTGSVLIGLGKQDGASIEPTVAVVAEGANKYLSFTKQNGEAVKMAWLVFQNNSGVNPEDTLYFDAKMRMTKIGGNNETHIRFYKDRLVSKPSAGTEISSAARLKITAADGSLSIGGINTGLAANEWFTLRLVFSVDQVVVYVAGADGVFAPVTSVAADFSTFSSLQFTNQNSDQSTFDFDWVYYGAEYSTEEPDEGDEPEVEEEEEFVPGTNTFEDYAEGNYILDNTAATKVNHIINGANAQGETKIVVDADGNKYLQMVKSVGASSAAQTWLAFVRTMDVPAGTPLVFEAKMSVSFTNGSSAYFRFYKGSTIEKGNDGTIYGNKANGATSSESSNIALNYSDGTLHIDTTHTKINLGVTKGEWFTMRLVMSGTTIVVFVADETGKFVEMGKIERSGWTGDITECNSIVYMNDSSTTLSVGVDNVYFGPYVPDVESPIENLPAKESNLPEGNISFNAIEETALPEEIELLTDGDSALGVVAVSKSNKVLYLDKNAAADARVYLDATKKTVGANVLSFATQMYFDKIEADGYVDFTLMPSGSAEADRVYKIRLGASAEGNLTLATVALVDGADVAGEATDTGVAVGEWFKLSIVYTEKDNTFAVSVNGEAKLSATAPYGMFKDASAISQILVLASDALVADVYFENMSLSQIIAE